MDPKGATNESRTPERFLELITPIKRGLLGYCRTLSRDQESAKDLASEAIVIAYQAFGKMRDEAALKSYLYTTVKRLARDDWQRAQRHTEIEAASAARSSDASPEVLADIRILQEALMQLPEAQRDTVVLHELSGLKLEEIREIQGGSLSAVKMRLLRGKQRLTELLGESKRAAKARPEQSNTLSTFSI